MSPEKLKAEKESLLAEIHEAFDGVKREGGISWRQSALQDSEGYDRLADYVDDDKS